MNAELGLTLTSKLIIAEYKDSFVMEDDYEVASIINRFIKTTYGHIKFQKNFYPNKQDLDKIEELRKHIIPDIPHTPVTLDIKLCSIPEEIYKEVCIYILFANWQSSIKTSEEIEEMFIYIKQKVNPLYYNIASVLYKQFKVQWQIDSYSAF
jgi:hypothetical protein